MAVTVAWKGKKFEVPILDQHGSPDFTSTTLGVLVQKCSMLTGVPTDRIKLLASGDRPSPNQSPYTSYTSFNQSNPYQQHTQSNQQTGDDFFDTIGSSFSKMGKAFTKAFDQVVDGVNRWVEGDTLEGGSWVVMKDMNASLLSYGIRNGSKVMMIGDHAPPPTQSARPAPYPPQRTSSQAPTSYSTSQSRPTAPRPPPQTQQTFAQSPAQLSLEARALHKIDSIHNDITETVYPLVEAYVALAKQYLEGDRTHPLKKVTMEYKRVEDLLEKGIIQLDCVDAPEGEAGVMVRARRKEVIGEFKKALARIDGVRAQVEASSSSL